MVNIETSSVQFLLQRKGLPHMNFAIVEKDFVQGADAKREGRRLHKFIRIQFNGLLFVLPRESTAVKSVIFLPEGTPREYKALKL